MGLGPESASDLFSGARAGAARSAELRAGGGRRRRRVETAGRDEKEAVVRAQAAGERAQAWRGPEIIMRLLSRGLP